ncbi:hypothetical protein RI367_001242 [Sorochytrium milnesiophthora]
MSAGRVQGWWTLVLRQATRTVQQQQHQSAIASALASPPPSVTGQPPPPPHNPRNDDQGDRILLKTFGKPPVKPSPPDNCCMSGCVHCVWDLYADELVEYGNARLKWYQERVDTMTRWLSTPQTLPSGINSTQIRNALNNDNARIANLRAERAQLSAGGDPRAAAMMDMDPTLRAFWELEQRNNQTKASSTPVASNA